MTHNLKSFVKRGMYLSVLVTSLALSTMGLVRFFATQANADAPLYVPNPPPDTGSPGGGGSGGAGDGVGDSSSDSTGSDDSGDSDGGDAGDGDGCDGDGGGDCDGN